MSIAGEMDGVERARARVRELAPLVFTFDLPIVPTVEAIPHDLNDPFLKATQAHFNTFEFDGTSSALISFFRILWRGLFSH